jgi:hypothetical protein
MMVNNSTNNKKTNNQNHCKNNPRHITLEIRVLTLEMHQHLPGLNQLMGSQNLCLQRYKIVLNSYRFSPPFSKSPINSLLFTLGVGLWRLMQLSTIFQLFRGGNFYWWRQPEKTTAPPQIASH